MTTTITMEMLREFLAQGAGGWQGRTTDYEHEDDTHLTAWAWVGRPDDVELAGAEVEVRHRDYAGGAWVRVIGAEVRS